MISVEQLGDQLAQQAETIQTLVKGVTNEQAVWKAEVGQWSILEVVNHLCDEEIEDFRAHLRQILLHPEQPWSKIDPQGWVNQRGYNQKQLNTSVKIFLEARRESLNWLKTLPTSLNWDCTHPTPFGQISAGDLCASWVAHDLLHIRQLTELHWLYNIHRVQPYQVAYAGDW